MKPLFITFLIISVLFCNSFSETHVFWYKSVLNGYRMTDCIKSVTGPCLPRNVVIHEGMIAAGGRENNVEIGKNNNEFGDCGFFWSRNLNHATGSAVKATFRAEYLNGVGSCLPGNIHIRLGVADYMPNINEFGGLNYVPDSPSWEAHGNGLSRYMGFDSSTDSLAAEEAVVLVGPEGRTCADCPSDLDGRFFEVDVTDQVNWILSHEGQYAIVFVAIWGIGTYLGRIACYTYENCPEIDIIKGSINPWTTDGNTAHLVVESDDLTVDDYTDSITACAEPDGPEVTLTWTHPTVREGYDFSKDTIKNYLQSDRDLDIVLTDSRLRTYSPIAYYVEDGRMIMPNPTICFDKIVNAPKSGYYSSVKVDSSLAGKIMVLRTVEGHYVKLFIKSVDRDSATGTIAVSFIYFYQPDSSGNLSHSNKGQAKISDYSGPSLRILPNPFNSAVRIKIADMDYTMERVRLQVYDIDGRLVTHLVPHTAQRIPSLFFWNAEHRAHGIYLLKAFIGNRIFTKKLVLMK